MLGQILAYRLAAHYLGKEGFSEYAMARRSISLLAPLPLLGLSVALPRYVGYAIGCGDTERALRYFRITLWCIGCTTSICVLLMNLFPSQVSYLLFGSRSYGHLVFALSWILAGLALHGISYAYFRGNLAMKRANSLQFVNLGIVPLIALFAFSESVWSTLASLGMLTTAVAAGALLFTPWRGAIPRPWVETSELLGYGIQRAPADFIFVALFSVPAVLVAHMRGVQDAGLVAFGITVLLMIGSAFSPVGLILLPLSSRMLAEGARTELRTHVLRILKLAVIVSATISLVIGLFAGTLIELYLGEGFQNAATIIRVLIIGAPPLAIYCVLRGLIDAYHKVAFNTLSNMLAFLAFLVSALLFTFFHKTVLLPVALIVGLIVLGSVTAIEGSRILSLLASRNDT